MVFGKSSSGHNQVHSGYPTIPALDFTADDGLMSSKGHPVASSGNASTAQSSWEAHAQSHNGYDASTAPSAPPLSGHVAGARDLHRHQPYADNQPPLPPGQMLVTTPKIEAQPWVKDLWSRLAAGTVGVARVDLRRPTFPWAEDYDENNILLRRQGGARQAHRGRGRPPAYRGPPMQGAYYDDGRYLGGPGAAPSPNAGREGPGGWLGRAVGGAGAVPTGARLKVMRCVQVKLPEDKRPLLDFGIGLGLDLDGQALHGVVRFKLRDWVSIKLAPRPLLKIAHTWRLPVGSCALRLRYECPLSNLDSFWTPPARLMLRLDNDVGTGIHLSPGGVEFDERRVALGESTEVRASASMRFPRQLPWDPDDPDAFKLQVNRLSLKTLW